MTPESVARLKSSFSEVTAKPGALTVAPLAGEEMATLGEVLSSLTVTDAFAVFPALSRAVPLTTWPAVSVVIVTGAGQNAMPLVWSEQVNVTVGLTLFQPAALGGGALLAVIVGGALSTPMIWITKNSPGFPRSSTVN